MNTETKVLLGLAAVVAGVAVYALSAKPAAKSSTVPPSTNGDIPPKAPQTWPVTLSPLGVPGIVIAKVGDSININAGGETIEDVQATSSGVVLIPPVPTSGTLNHTIKVVGAGVTSVTVLWGLTYTSVIGVEAS